MPIRVLLVDDDPLVRSGLRYLSDSADDLTVVAEAGDGDEAVAAVREHQPDVVLMDLRLPRVDGITATAQVRALPHPPHVIALTTWDVDDAVLRSLEAGASGFLLKSADPKDILRAVRSVMAGDAVLSPRSTRQLLDHLRADDTTGQRRQAEQVVGSLTDREREVCAEVGRGLSNAEIAKVLYIADATVKAHLSTIQTKLGVRNRVEIAVLAERAGLLRPS
ncbi:MAG: response regulator transcription factor [Propionibacteriaceae bacterium]|nr:response regulator transcription factor [Propionibacteriaceae bacterium]